MPAYGERLPVRGDTGADVVELQMRLAGFRGTVPDGNYGPGTELQVTCFQRDWMGLASPHGQADQATFDAIKDFGAVHPLDFQALKCDCGKCGGFGSGKFKGKYPTGYPESEAYLRYEYPGIHRMILWAFRTAVFYCRKRNLELAITSGYRCSESNRIHKRTSTNHHGKAIDFGIIGVTDNPKDMQLCDEIRGMLVETANAQIGWGGSNRKSLEPSHIAPNWVHYDVRSYERRYLDDHYFVRSAQELDSAPV